MGDTSSYITCDESTPLYTERPRTMEIRQRETKIDLKNSLDSLLQISKITFLSRFMDLSKENANDKISCEIKPDDNILHISIITKNNYIQIPKYFFGECINKLEMRQLLQKYKHIYSKFSIEWNGNTLINYRFYFTEKKLESPNCATS